MAQPQMLRARRRAIEVDLSRTRCYGWMYSGAGDRQAILRSAINDARL